VSPIEAALVVVALALPLHALVFWQIARLESPRVLRRCGIVVMRESVLDGHSEAIGEYAGRQIWGTVTFKGMLYRYDRRARPQEREKTGPGELWLEPGLVYVLA
jgi:hypothetical protein